MHDITHGDMTLRLLEGGNIHALYAKDIMINQLPGHAADAPVANIYLRQKTAKGYDHAPLMGRQTHGRIHLGENGIVYEGEVLSFAYRLRLLLCDTMWFYEIRTSNKGPAREMDFIFIQDIGLATEGHVASNEAYNSHYIGHSVFETEAGYVIAQRQNQPQQGKNPYVQHGCLQGAVSYATDGYDVFGLGYKFDDRIVALDQDSLKNRIYQYEFAMAALQGRTERFEKAATGLTVFYGAFMPHIETAILRPLGHDALVAAYEQAARDAGDYRPLPQMPPPRFPTGNIVPYRGMAAKEVKALYPERRHEEYGPDGELFSFFTTDAAHVVLGEKEAWVERAHGNIIITGQNDFIKEEIMAATQFIYGVFAAQIVVGNTSFHQFNGPCRNMLNVQKSTGLRAYLKIDGCYRLLAMPALFEMGPNYGKWLYQTELGRVIVIAYTALDGAFLRIKLQAEGPIDVAFTTEIAPFGEMTQACYPQLAYITYPAAQAPGLWLFNATCEADLIIEGRLHEPDKRTEHLRSVFMAAPFEVVALSYREWLHRASGGLSLSIDTADVALRLEVEAQNDILPWFSHNARVHYCSPHGLEQFGGAAWGTRDVCQGPAEYFTAIGNFPVLRDILLRVYKGQYDDGTWPQWAMFDRYQAIRSSESHGDIIVWPLMALAAYLNATGDFAILTVELPYTSREQGHEATAHAEALMAHVGKQIGHIRSTFIEGTALSRYGDGDWDDTLQPHDPALREQMVSTWSVALTYQAFTEFARGLRGHDNDWAEDLQAMAAAIKRDFFRHLVPDGITAGFAIFEESGIRYLLHPRDEETGLKYRLLPMTRSMIAGLFDEDQKDVHLGLIRERMYHPDGVRLMDRPSRYFGGVNRYFKRAETAANFGREIGLLYSHAQLRFVEAMTRIGEAGEAWRGLAKTNPILRRHGVENALPLQHNCFFSSSDACFDNRYEAMEHFDRLRDGAVAVKTGWRIYSSGPGLYISRLVNDILGIRRHYGDWLIDPVLETRFSGLRLELTCEGRHILFEYVKGGSGGLRVMVDGRQAEGRAEDGPYRKGGILIADASVRDGSRILVEY